MSANGGLGEEGSTDQALNKMYEMSGLPNYYRPVSEIALKGAQVWDFDVLDFNDFFIMNSI